MHQPIASEVVDGVWAIPVPMTDKALSHNFAYAFVDGDTVVLVDTGYDTEPALSALVSGLAVAGVRVEAISAILVTHHHRDHYGLAHRLRSMSESWIALHPADALVLERRRKSPASVATLMYPWFIEMGVPTSEFRGMLDGVPSRESSSNPPDRLMEGGDEILVGPWTFHVRHTPGHTPGHVCLVEKQSKVILTGDHILPRITPNVTKAPGSLENPLMAFLESLRDVGQIGPLLLLPGHEYPGGDLPSRVSHLTHHHACRLKEVHETICDGAESVWQIARRLTWSRPWMTMAPAARRLAIGETFAHIHYLEEEGKIQRLPARSPTRWIAARE